MKNIIIMVVFLLALVIVQFANGESVDDIIDQYIAARGGKAKLMAIKTLYLEGTREMMGNVVQVKLTKENGKLSRLDFEFEGNSGYTIVTPDKGWSYIPMRSDKAEEIDQERLAALQDQLDIAGSLVDYAVKGFKASLNGKDTINGKRAWKVELTSNTGKIETFYIDAKTNLLIQSKKFTEGGIGNDGSIEMTTDYSDYKDIDGIMFPQIITTGSSGIESGLMTFAKIEANQPINESLYTPSN